jgi:hypothetical protein
MLSTISERKRLRNALRTHLKERRTTIALTAVLTGTKSFYGGTPYRESVQIATTRLFSGPAMLHGLIER